MFYLVILSDGARLQLKPLSRNCCPKQFSPLIDVQTGTYVGEDDIVRYEDVYAREGK